MGLLSNMPEGDRQAAISLAKWGGGALVLMVALLWWAGTVDEKQAQIYRDQTAPWAEMVRAQMRVKLVEAPEPGGGYVTGRILPIDRVARKVDGIFLNMRNDIRSAKPDDVGTVVWLEYGDKEVGSYSGGSKAFVRTATVTVVDRARNATVARRVVEGGPPPETVKKGSAGYGPRPSNEVLQYLYSLPKR